MLLDFPSCPLLLGTAHGAPQAGGRGAALDRPAPGAGSSLGHRQDTGHGKRVKGLLFVYPMPNPGLGVNILTVI